VRTITVLNCLFSSIRNPSRVSVSDSYLVKSRITRFARENNILASSIYSILSFQNFTVKVKFVLSPKGIASTNSLIPVLSKASRMSYSLAIGFSSMNISQIVMFGGLLSYLK